MSGDRSDRTLMRQIRQGMRVCKLAGFVMRAGDACLCGSAPTFSGCSWQSNAFMIHKVGFLGRRETANRITFRV